MSSFFKSKSKNKSKLSSLPSVSSSSLLSLLLMKKNKHDDNRRDFGQLFASGAGQRGNQFHKRLAGRPNNCCCRKLLNACNGAIPCQLPAKTAANQVENQPASEYSASYRCGLISENKRVAGNDNRRAEIDGDKPATAAAASLSVSGIDNETNCDKLPDRGSRETRPPSLNQEYIINFSTSRTLSSIDSCGQLAHSDDDDNCNLRHYLNEIRSAYYEEIIQDFRQASHRGELLIDTPSSSDASNRQHMLLIVFKLRNKVELADSNNRVQRRRRFRCLIKFNPIEDNAAGSYYFKLEIELPSALRAHLTADCRRPRQQFHLRLGLPEVVSGSPEQIIDVHLSATPQNSTSGNSSGGGDKDNNLKIKFCQPKTDESVLFVYNQISKQQTSLKSVALADLERLALLNASICFSHLLASNRQRHEDDTPGQRRQFAWCWASRQAEVEARSELGAKGREQEGDLTTSPGAKNYLSTRSPKNNNILLGHQHARNYYSRRPDSRCCCCCSSSSKSSSMASSFGSNSSSWAAASSLISPGSPVSSSLYSASSMLSATSSQPSSSIGNCRRFCSAGNLRRPLRGASRSRIRLRRRRDKKSRRSARRRHSKRRRRASAAHHCYSISTTTNDGNGAGSTSSCCSYSTLEDADELELRHNCRGSAADNLSSHFESEGLEAPGENQSKEASRQEVLENSKVVALDDRRGQTVKYSKKASSIRPRKNERSQTSRAKYRGYRNLEPNQKLDRKQQGNESKRTRGYNKHINSKFYIHHHHHHCVAGQHLARMGPHRGASSQRASHSMGRELSLSADNIPVGAEDMVAGAKQRIGDQMQGTRSAFGSSSAFNNDPASKHGTSAATEFSGKQTVHQHGRQQLVLSNLGDHSGNDSLQQQQQQHQQEPQLDLLGFKCPNCQTKFHSSEAVMVRNEDTSPGEPLMSKDDLCKKPGPADERRRKRSSIEVILNRAIGNIFNREQQQNQNQLNPPIRISNESAASGEVQGQNESVSATVAESDQGVSRQPNQVENKAHLSSWAAGKAPSRKNSELMFESGLSTAAANREQQQQQGRFSRNLLSPMDLIWRPSSSEQSSSQRALSCTETSLSEHLSSSLAAQLAAATRSKSLCAASSNELKEAKSGSDGTGQNNGSLVGKNVNAFLGFKKFSKGGGNKVSGVMGKITRNAINHLKKLSLSNPNITGDDEQDHKASANYRYGELVLRRANSQRASNKRKEFAVIQPDEPISVISYQLNSSSNEQTRKFAASTSVLNNSMDEDEGLLLYSRGGVYIGPGGALSKQELLKLSPSSSSPMNVNATSGKRGQVKPSTSSSRKSSEAGGGGRLFSGASQGGAASWLAKPLKLSGKIRAQAPLTMNNQQKLNDTDRCNKNSIATDDAYDAACDVDDAAATAAAADLDNGVSLTVFGREQAIGKAALANRPSIKVYDDEDLAANQFEVGQLSSNEIIISQFEEARKARSIVSREASSGALESSAHLNEINPAATGRRQFPQTLSSSCQDLHQDSVGAMSQPAAINKQQASQQQQQQSKINKPWTILNLTQRKLSSTSISSKSPPDSKRGSQKKKQQSGGQCREKLTACESSKLELELGRKPPGKLDGKNQACLAKETRSNSLSGLNFKINRPDLRRSYMELNCKSNDNNNHLHEYSGSSSNLIDSAAMNALAAMESPSRMANKPKSAGRQSASSAATVNNNSQSKQADYWFRRSSKQPVSADYGPTTTELYGANLQTICVHCQLISELAHYPKSLYLSQLLASVPSESLNDDDDDLDDERQQRQHDEGLSICNYPVICLPSDDSAEGQGSSFVVSKPSVVLTACSRNGTIDNDDGDEEPGHEELNSAASGESAATDLHTSQQQRHRRSSSSASLISKLTQELNSGKQASELSQDEAELEDPLLLDDDEDEEQVDDDDDEEDFDYDEFDHVNYDNSSLITNNDLNISSSSESQSSSSAANCSDGDSSDSEVADANLELIDCKVDPREPADQAAATTMTTKQLADSQKLKRHRNNGGGSGRQTKSNATNREHVTNNNPPADRIIEPIESSSSSAKMNIRAVRGKKKSKQRHGGKKSAASKSGAHHHHESKRDKLGSDTKQPKGSASGGLLEVPSQSKQNRSASLDAPYLLKVPDRPDLEANEFSLLTGDSQVGGSEFNLNQSKSNRSRSVDISLPTRPGESYKIASNNAEQTNSSANSKLAPDVNQVVDGRSLDEQKKFIQGEIKIACANGETKSLKLFVNWKDDCSNGEHLWIYIGSSSEACYVGENECLKHGPRLCCSACKIAAHTGCISILIDKIKFICKHTFKDLTVTNPRHLKELQQQNVIYHHWVHKRTHCGRCKQCTKTFGNTKLPFSSKEIQAITCSWCKVSYHNKENCYTLSALTEPCTLGIHRESIVPPLWILKLPPSSTAANKTSAVAADKIVSSLPQANQEASASDSLQSENLIDLSMTSHSQQKALRISSDNDNSENLLQRQHQHHSNPASNKASSNHQQLFQTYGSNTTLMTDTSGYTSADGFNNMQSNNSNNNISANSNARILYEHQDRNKLPSPSANYAQNLNCSEEILIDPTALQASDLSLINQGQQRQQQKHPQENMSQYQKHQIKQYYKQMDVNNEQLQQNNNNNNSMSDDTFMDLQLTQHQQQLQLFQQQHQIQTSPSKQSFNGHSNFKIVPTPIQGVPNAGSKPVLVFVNPRSGGNQGAKMMQKFNWLLNPRQVFDLIEAGGPRAALELYRDVPNLRILTIGGDGTASWILSYLDEVGIPNKIPVAVLPLGTGNDLARALGWGGGYTDEPIAKILTQVRDGEIVQLDRWNLHVEKNYEVAPVSPNEFSTGSGNALTNSTMEISPSSITSSPSYFNSLTPSSTTTTFNQQTSTPLSTISIIDDSSSNQQQSNVVNNDEIGCDRLPMDVINNYFSFGVDAHIALEFHTAREAHPERFNSRLRNKMFYGQAGGKDLLKRKWKDLSNFVTLYCDGQDMTGRLKELKVHSVLFLNIPSYGGGTRPWPTTGATSSVFSKPRTDDGMIEVIGLTTYQLPLLQAGGHGTCIAQCRNAKIITSRTIPMQVDGEPCKLLPSIINIGFRNRVCMLAKSKSSNKNNINMTTSNIQKMN